MIKPGQKWYHNVSLNYTSLNIITIALVMVLFVSYIGLVNNTASKGLGLSSLENQLAEIKSQNTELELQINSLQSMAHVKQLNQELAFEPVDQVEYLSIQPSAVALSE